MAFCSTLSSPDKSDHYGGPTMSDVKGRLVGHEWERNPIFSRQALRAAARAQRREQQQLQQEEGPQIEDGSSDSDSEQQLQQQELLRQQSCARQSQGTAQACRTGCCAGYSSMHLPVHHTSNMCIRQEHRSNTSCLHIFPGIMLVHPSPLVSVCEAAVISSRHAHHDPR
jgi:hypothetical protein